MNPLRSLCLAGAALAAASPVTSQDLLGVSWSGSVVRIDSHTGAVSSVGVGLSGLNCLARGSNGAFYSVRRVSSSFHMLVTIDPATGATTPIGGCADVRGLAEGPGNTLYGVRYTPFGNTLIAIDAASGGYATIGSTGFVGIQGLAVHQNTLYAWDVLEGLLVVDPLTGAATDPFPGVPVPTYLQSLCSHPDGRLLVGGGDSNGVDPLYVVDLATGAPTLIGQMNGAVDLRGIEPLGAFVSPFGQGCNGVFGPVSLSVTGSPQPGGFLSTTSTNHAANAFGLIVFGADSLVFNGTPLPVLLDPLFGTSGCRLYTAIDGALPMIAGAAGPASLQFGFAVPPTAGGELVHLQHVCLENVPGGMSWSNAVAVRIE